MKDFIKALFSMFITCACTTYTQDYLTPNHPVVSAIVFVVGLLIVSLYILSGTREIKHSIDKWLKRKGVAR